MLMHLSGIAHFRKIETSKSPLGAMHRLQIFIMGMRRAKWPTARNLPFIVDVMRPIRDLLDFCVVGQGIARCSVLLGWFFMLMMVSSL